jgi:hypothetical protein
MVCKLTKGFQSHHKPFKWKNFLKKTGIEAKNDAKNIKILQVHYHSLLNCHSEVHYSVLDSNPKHEIRHQMGEVPREKFQLGPKKKGSANNGE